jgi:hypothetical protein
MAVTQIPPVNPNSSYFDGTSNSFPPDQHFSEKRFSSDFAYAHMDLNPLVRAAADRANIPSICHGLTAAFRLDPLHWSLPALAPGIRERLRACVEDGMRLQGNPTLLGLDFGSAGFFHVIFS